MRQKTTGSVIYKSNFVSKFLNVFLSSGGISVSRKYKKFELWYSFFITSVTMIQLVGSLIGFLNTSQMENKTEILIQIATHSFLFSQYWNIKMHKNNLRKFKCMFDGKFLDYMNMEAIQLTAELFEKIIFIISSLFGLFLLMIIIISFFVPFFVDFHFNEKYIYVMPQWFSCTDSKENNFPLTFLCLNIDSYNKYFLMNMVEVILLIIELFSYVNGFIFYALAQAHFKARFEIIIGRINNTFVDDKRIKIDDSTMCTDLIEIVKYHQYLRK